MPTTEHQSQRDLALSAIRCEVDGQLRRSDRASTGTQKGGGAKPLTPSPFDRLADADSHIETYRATIRYGIG